MRAFFAYPGNPSQLGDTIEAAVTKFGKAVVAIETWKQMDIAGAFIRDQVLDKIDAADILLADISVLNFNVTYEIGYAIGKKKRIVLTKNVSIKERAPFIRETGIFDTLGFTEYENSDQLKSIFSDLNKLNPIKIPGSLNLRTPVYLLEPKYKTDFVTRIVSRIKKARYSYRQFDPVEIPRLSAYEAIENVSQSYGVLVTLLSINSAEHAVHNLRGAFIAGLSHGLGKVTTLIQNEYEDPIPLDYRDIVKICIHPQDIDETIGEFANEVAEAIQQTSSPIKSSQQTILQQISLGANSAENEIKNLESYYLATDPYLQAKRGEAHLVIGRKGSGKSAIFFQIRDGESNRISNIVVDLKPEGYKLIKFKELILKYLTEGTRQHTIMAFWEYLLLLEIARKILDRDSNLHMRDARLVEPYKRLQKSYKLEDLYLEGDFSERMSMLMEKIAGDYKAKYGDQDNVKLSQAEITDLIYKNDVRELSDSIFEYLKHKEKLWLLFDNIDKGWATEGIDREDLISIRTLIDATRKIEQQLNRHDVEVNTVIFLRNDVYELLVKETADRGKEARVMLDWTDADLLRELVRLRLTSNPIFDIDDPFDKVWRNICISHINGEESAQYLIDRCLMRPRFLINLINQCKSHAINLNHSKVELDDVEKGLKAYSTDLITDIGFEIRDIDAEAEDILYAFIDCPENLTQSELERLLLDWGLKAEKHAALIDLLLWYGFLGIKQSDEKFIYIYSLNYNMKLLRGVISKAGTDIQYGINPAFIPALSIS